MLAPPSVANRWPHLPQKSTDVRTPGRGSIRCGWSLLLAVALGSLPAAAGEVNLVRNGDFSAGLANWSMHGNADVGTLSQKACLPHQSGNPYLYINAYWGLDGWVEQEVTLPDEAATLTFRTWGHLDPVTASVRIVDGQSVEHVLETFTPPITEWSENANDPSKPLQCTGNTDIPKSYSLSAFAGQTIKLRFRVTSNGTNGTFGDFDDVEILVAESQLSATLEVDPTEVELEDTFKVKLTVTNEGDAALTNVAPADGGMDGTGTASLVSGPTPASVASLAPGASASFVSTVQATGEGKITLHASARAKNSLNQTVESNTASSPEVTIGPFIVLIRLSSTGAKSQILPGGQITVHAEFMKVGKTQVTVSLDPEMPLLVGLEPAVLPADTTGSVAVDLAARVADETNDEVMANIIDGVNGTGEISLASRVFVKAEYTVGETPRTRTFYDSLLKADNSTWSITYPNYAVVTGEPPAGSPTELEYYQRGNVRYWEYRPNRPEYLKDRLTRKWMLKAIRYGAADGLTPPEPRDAAVNLAQFLVDHLPFSWKGSGSEIRTWAEQLESNAAHGPTACVNYSFYYEAATRVVGLRSRGMNNAMKYLLGWAQHATNQVWFDGQWNWFDCALAKSYNGGQVIRDYPQAYFTRVKYGGVLPYGQIKTWYAIDGHNYNFVLGNDDGMSSELREPEKWAFYAYHNKRDLVAAGDPQSDAMRESALIITVHSPVLTLYTDAQGRRLGAAGPLTSADFLGIDAVPPLTGGGSIWEIPGGAYIAPGIHTQFGVHESCAEVVAEEQVVIPIAEADGPFALSLTGTGDGAYRVAVQHATESGTTDLYSQEGTIAQGETVQLDLQVDRSGETPTVEPQAWTLTPVGPPCFGLPLVTLALLLTPFWARQKKAASAR